MNKKISYVIPCYNVENYLERCIYSIQNQELTIEDYEVIIIDDGSTDNTRNIINKYAQLENFKLFFYEKPSGFAGRPRNKGIELSVGDYILFLDPDDYLVKNSIKQVLLQCEENDIIINSFYIINEKNTILDQVKLKNREINKNKKLWGQIKNVCNQRTLYKRDFILKNNILFNEDLRSQDLLFLYSAYIQTNKILSTNIFTTYYLDLREDSISNDINEKFIITSIKMLDVLLDIINGNLSNKEVESIMQEHFIAFYLKSKHKLSSEHKKLIKESNFYKILKK